MSMWEFEALAEMSVDMVDASALSPREKRNAYANIYALVGDWDVSFVHFRSTRALERASFFHRIDITQHPDYSRHRDYFDPIIAAGKSAWIGNPEAGPDEYASDAFYEPDPPEKTFLAGLWFDSTMPLWSRAVDAGLLTGLAAEPVEEWSRKETIARLIALAAKQDSPRYGLLKMLHGMVGYLVVTEGAALKAGDETLSAVRDLPALKAALANPQEDWIDERFDARQALEYSDAERKPFLEWWCAIYPD